MKNLIKCHFAYFMSKITLTIFLIIIFLLILTNVFALFAVDSEVSYIRNNFLYFYNVFMVIRIVLIFLSIFIYSYFFLNKNDQYVILIYIRGVSRVKYFITKIITINIILFITIYILYFIYIIIGTVYIDYFYFNINYMYSFIYLFIIINFFGLLGLLLIQLVNNIYTIIITFIVANISLIINDNNGSIKNVYNFLIPYLDILDNKFSYGLVHVLLIVILIFIINIYFYQNKDLGK